MLHECLGGLIIETKSYPNVQKVQYVNENADETNKNTDELWNCAMCFFPPRKNFTKATPVVFDAHDK
jgi:hypothetical protein